MLVHDRTGAVVFKWSKTGTTVLRKDIFSVDSGGSEDVTVHGVRSFLFDRAY